MKAPVLATDPVQPIGAYLGQLPSDGVNTVFSWTQLLGKPLCQASARSAGQPCHGSSACFPVGVMGPVETRQDQQVCLHLTTGATHLCLQAWVCHPGHQVTTTLSIHLRSARCFPGAECRDQCSPGLQASTLTRGEVQSRSKGEIGPPAESALLSILTPARTHILSWLLFGRK